MKKKIREELQQTTRQTASTIEVDEENPSKKTKFQAIKTKTSVEIRTTLKRDFRGLETMETRGRGALFAAERSQVRPVRPIKFRRHN